MAEKGNRIVITGIGAVSCLGFGVASLWDGLINGRCGIRRLTRLDPEAFRIQHAGEVPLRQDDLPDPSGDLAVHFANAACVEALNQARIPPEDRKGAALVLASNFGEMATTERILAKLQDADFPTEALADGPTALVAERLGLGGPRASLSLSCASGNAAIGYAADLIRAGDAEVVVAGGYDAICEVVWAGLCSLRAMSAKAVRPFDRRRDGTIFAEGAGVVVLEEEGHALRRGAAPLAEFLGYTTTSNAFHMTHPDPDGGGMVRAMAGAISDARLTPDEIDHVNAHATGTPSNDKLETLAVKSVFGSHAGDLAINGIKSMLGHAMGAAGALEAIASIMTIREGVIPPTIGLDEPDPECDLDYTPLQAKRAEVRTVLNNSAGFGGCNASVVLRRWEE